MTMSQSGMDLGSMTNDQWLELQPLLSLLLCAELSNFPYEPSFENRDSWQVLSTFRYLQFPSYGKKGQRTIGNLYNTFMEYAGKPQDQFGRLDLNIDAELQRGPLPELIS